MYTRIGHPSVGRREAFGELVVDVTQDSTASFGLAPTYRHVLPTMRQRAQDAGWPVDGESGMDAHLVETLNRWFATSAFRADLCRALAIVPLVLIGVLVVFAWATPRSSSPKGRSELLLGALAALAGLLVTCVFMKPGLLEVPDVGEARLRSPPGTGATGLGRPSTRAHLNPQR